MVSKTNGTAIKTLEPNNRNIWRINQEKCGSPFYPATDEELLQRMIYYLHMDLNKYLTFECASEDLEDGEEQKSSVDCDKF